MKTLRLLLLTSNALLAALLMASGCTIIRPGPPENNGNNGNNGEGPQPKVVDMLVLTQLDRSAGNLAPAYADVLGVLEVKLAEKNVVIRRLAIAPLHRRSGDVVPLIYGREDAEGEFESPQEAVFFYASDNGGQYLQESATGEAENLAVLGLELDERAIYHPTSADPTARAYFQQAADGLIVATFSASARLCAADEPACELNGQPAADYFTDTDGNDGASWLSLPGTKKLGPSKIFHAAFVTAEGMNASEFESHCRDFPNFPSTYLDFMEPSAERFYEPMTQRISQRGGHATFVDLCEVLSSNAEARVDSLAGDIARVF